jgi:hypothetical protein
MKLRLTARDDLGRVRCGDLQDPFRLAASRKRLEIQLPTGPSRDRRIVGFEHQALRRRSRSSRKRHASGSLDAKEQQARSDHRASIVTSPAYRTTNGSSNAASRPSGTSIVKLKVSALARAVAGDDENEQPTGGAHRREYNSRLKRSQKHR